MNNPGVKIKAKTRSNQKKNSHLVGFLSEEEKENLVKKVEGCSKRATEKLLSERDPSLSLPKREDPFLGKRQSGDKNSD